MAKYIDLTPEQKDEIRRLTQLHNRRVKAAERAYTKAGKTILPLEIVGKKELQLKENWHTKNTPLSRSVKFESQKEYRRHLHFLRQTENLRPGIKEYTEVQRQKTSEALKTALGAEVSFATIDEKLAKLTAPQLSDFWNKFSDKAKKMGMNYSSEAVMEQTFAELFPEDLYSTLPKKAG